MQPTLGEQLAALTQSAQSRRESQRDDARLRQELAASERELTALGDGVDLDVLRTRARLQDPSAMRARLLEIETQLPQLDDEVGALDQSIGGGIECGADARISTLVDQRTDTRCAVFVDAYTKTLGICHVNMLRIYLF